MVTSYNSLVDENTTVRAAALGVSSLIVLSTSVIVTVPDGGKVISASPEIDRQLMTSILFPLSQHLCVESFLVPPVQILGCYVWGSFQKYISDIRFVFTYICLGYLF